MAGHSKWANIQHRKGRQDEKRGKIWTRLIREITVSARTGGGRSKRQSATAFWPWTKPRQPTCPPIALSTTSTKLRENAEGMTYEEIRYEGYGIGGAAIIVDTMTDNRVAYRG